MWYYAYRTIIGGATEDTVPDPPASCHKLPTAAPTAAPPPLLLLLVLSVAAMTAATYYYHTATSQTMTVTHSYLNPKP